VQQQQQQQQQQTRQQTNDVGTGVHELGVAAGVVSFLTCAGCAAAAAAANPI
jgi:hypothetical protein